MLLENCITQDSRADSLKVELWTALELPPSKGSELKTVPNKSAGHCSTKSTMSHLVDITQRNETQNPEEYCKYNFIRTDLYVLYSFYKN